MLLVAGHVLCLLEGLSRRIADGLLVTSCVRPWFSLACRTDVPERFGEATSPDISDSVLGRSPVGSFSSRRAVRSGAGVASGAENASACRRRRPADCSLQDSMSTTRTLCSVTTVCERVPNRLAAHAGSDRLAIPPVIATSNRSGPAAASMASRGCSWPGYTCAAEGFRPACSRLIKAMASHRAGVTPHRLIPR